MNAPVILVVDDELLLLRSVQRGLRRAGYRCYISGDAAGAVALADQLGPRLALVLLDWGLPDRAALSLADQLWSRRPELPIVLTSGAAAWELSADLRARPFQSFLPKPFDPSDLHEHLRRALPGAGPWREARRK